MLLFFLILNNFAYAAYINSSAHYNTIGYT